MPLYATLMLCVGGFILGVVLRVWWQRHAAAQQWRRSGAANLAEPAEYRAYALTDDGRILIATGDAEQCRRAAIEYTWTHGVPCFAERVGK